MSDLPSTSQELQSVIVQTINSNVKLKDLPPGTALAKQLALNYGNISLQEPVSVFQYGISIWGKTRIGGVK